MKAVDRLRRQVLAATAGIALAALALPLAAQDPNASAAQRAARDWLAFTDRLDGEASWGASGAKFRAMMPAERWSVALREARGPCGAMQQRTGEATHFATTLRGFPDGDYAVVVFRTAFANKTGAVETVTLEREGGSWRVIGYSVA